MGQAGGESLRMRGICRGEYGGARRDALLGQTVMHVGRSQQAEAGVMVLGVVHGKNRRENVSASS